MGQLEISFDELRKLVEEADDDTIIRFLFQEGDADEITGERPAGKGTRAGDDRGREGWRV